MKKLLIVAVACAGMAGTSTQPAQAGCITGAIVGGIAGHFAGRHGLAGAAAGCAIGHHNSVMKRRARQQQYAR